MKNRPPTLFWIMLNIFLLVSLAIAWPSFLNRKGILFETLPANEKIPSRKLDGYLWKYQLVSSDSITIEIYSQTDSELIFDNNLSSLHQNFQAHGVYHVDAIRAGTVISAIKGEASISCKTAPSGCKFLVYPTYRLWAYFFGVVCTYYLSSLLLYSKLSKITANN